MSFIKELIEKRNLIFGLKKVLGGKVSIKDTNDFLKERDTNGDGWVDVKELAIFIIKKAIFK